MGYPGNGLAWTRSGLAHAAGTSLTVIDGLRAQGMSEAVEIPAARHWSAATFRRRGPVPRPRL